jgi:hypothetical protein
LGERETRFAGGFKITAENQIGFWVGPYDRERPLVIDPVLTYATYFTAASSAVAVDTAGDIYVAGLTGAGLPTQSAFQGSLSGSLGSGNDVATGLALDSQGNAYITGATGSTDFPTTPGAFMIQCPGAFCNTPFVAKFDPSGSFVYSTVTGGSYAFGKSIAVDGAGNAYITGSVSTTDLPVVNAFQPNFAGMIGSNGSNAFVQKLDPTGSQLLYSTYLGGGSDGGSGIAVDSSGSAYVVGRTAGNFPTQNPLQFDTSLVVQ